MNSYAKQKQTEENKLPNAFTQPQIMSFFNQNILPGLVGVAGVALCP
jgi:hypothetical protein